MFVKPCLSRSATSQSGPSPAHLYRIQAAPSTTHSSLQLCLASLHFPAFLSQGTMSTKTTIRSQTSRVGFSASSVRVSGLNSSGFSSVSMCNSLGSRSSQAICGGDGFGGRILCDVRSIKSVCMGGAALGLGKLW